MDIDARQSTVGRNRGTVTGLDIDLNGPPRPTSTLTGNRQSVPRRSIDRILSQSTLYFGGATVADEDKAEAFLKEHFAESHLKDDSVCPLGVNRIRAVWRIPPDLASSASCSVIPEVFRYYPCLWPTLLIGSPIWIFLIQKMKNRLKNTCFFVTETGFYKFRIDKQVKLKNKSIYGDWAPPKEGSKEKNDLKENSKEKETQPIEGNHAAHNTGIKKDIIVEKDIIVGKDLPREIVEWDLEISSTGNVEDMISPRSTRNFDDISRAYYPEFDINDECDPRLETDTLRNMEIDPDSSNEDIFAYLNEKKTGQSKLVPSEENRILNPANNSEENPITNPTTTNNRILNAKRNLSTIIAEGRHKAEPLKLDCSSNHVMLVDLVSLDDDKVHRTCCGELYSVRINLPWDHPMRTRGVSNANHDPLARDCYVELFLKESDLERSCEVLRECWKLAKRNKEKKDLEYRVGTANIAASNAMSQHPVNPAVIGMPMQGALQQTNGTSGINGSSNAGVDPNSNLKNAVDADGTIHGVIGGASPTAAALAMQSINQAGGNLPDTMSVHSLEQEAVCFHVEDNTEDL